MSPDALTQPAVTALLRERLDASLECSRLERGPLGNAQETWFIDARDAAGQERRLVLRRSAARGTLQDTDRRFEFALMRALAAHGFPVAPVHWLETEPSSLCRPYFVMDRLPGSPLRALSPANAASVARQIGSWLAALHAMDPQALAPAQAPPADCEAATRGELERWEQRYLRSRPAPVPLLGALLGWLNAHVPARGGPARMLWGDPGPHNVLVDGDRVTALLDWELAHLGDPLEDLGDALWAADVGGLQSEEILAGYEAQAAPADRTALTWFEIFACVNRSIMVLGGVAAYLDGRGSPAAAALGQQLLLANLQRAAELAGWRAAPSRQTPPQGEPPPSRLRPDVPEIASGVARFLREDVLATTADRRLRRDLKAAAALLDSAAARAQRGAPDTARGVDVAADLEASARRAELERLPERTQLRSLLLTQLAEQRAAIASLDRLFGPSERAAS